MIIFYKKQKDLQENKKDFQRNKKDFLENKKDQFQLIEDKHAWPSEGFNGACRLLSSSEFIPTSYLIILPFLIC